MSVEAEAARITMLNLRRELRILICRSKRSAWSSLLCDLNRDLWGRAYRIVIKKLKPFPPVDLRLLLVDKIEGIISSLFPCVPLAGGVTDSPRSSHNIPDSVTPIEVRLALRGGKNS